MDCPSLYAFIHDIKRFTLYSRLGIEQAPLQIYCSALVFAPAKSQVRKQFKSQMPCWVQRLPDVQNNWGPLLQTLEGHRGEGFSVTYSPDGKQLVSASGHMVRLWNAATGEALETFESKGSVKAVTFSPDGILVASAHGGDESGTVQLWDAATGATLRTLKVHRDIAGAVAISPDGKIVASVLHNNIESDRESDMACEILLWNSATGATLQTLKCRILSELAFSPDSKMVAFSSSSMMIRLWDTGTGAELQALKSRGWSNAVVFSPDGKKVALGLSDGGVQLWDVATCVTWQTPEGHRKRVNAVAFSPDSKMVASASDDKTIRLWDAATGVALQTLEGHTHWVTAVAFSPDSKVVASGSWDQTVRLWDIATYVAPQTLKSYRDPVNAVAFSPDGNAVASASHDNTIQLWDVATGVAQQTLKGHTSSVQAVEFSPDGKVVASGSSDKTVRLWDVATGMALKMLKGHTRAVCTVAFSPDGKIVASVSNDHTGRLWNVATGRPTQKLVHEFPNFTNPVAFSPDGKVVALGGCNIIRLWDTARGALLQILKGQVGYIDAVAFSLDGTIVASASRHGTVWLWNAATGVALQNLQSYWARELFFSNEGLYLDCYGHRTGLSYIQPNSAGVFAPAPPLLQTPFRKGNWVAQGEGNLLWLPPNYRAELDFKGNVFVFRDMSGQVIFIIFSNSVPLRK